MTIGNHQLLHGDCLELLQSIPDESVDLVACDLPYQITKNRWDILIDMNELWAHYQRITKPQSAICLTASQPFTSMLVTSNMKMFKHEWIWIKNAGSNFANTVREPMKEHETVLMFSKGKWTYNKQMQERTGGGAARVKTPVKFETASDNYREFEGREAKHMPEMRVPSSWQKFNRERGLHPTQKPVLLFEYLIKTYTDEGQVVLDNTFGSCTTGIAALRQNRTFIGMEKDPDYFKLGSERFLAEYNLKSFVKPD